MALSNSNASGRNRRAQFRTNLLPFRSSPPSWGEESVMDMNSTQSSSPSHPNCISPMNPPQTIKEVANTIDGLRKENFDLKVRLFFMEEKLKSIFSREQIDAFKLDLDINVKTLQDQVTIREKLIQQMSHEAINAESDLSKARQKIAELEQEVLSLKQELKSVQNKEETFSTPMQSDCDSSAFKAAFGLNATQISATIPHGTDPSTDEEIQRLSKELETLQKEFQIKNEELEHVKKKSHVKSVSIQALTTKLQQYVKAADSEMSRLMKEGLEAATENDTEGIIFVVHKIKEYLSKKLPQHQKETTSEKGVLHTTYDVDKKQPKSHSEDLLKIYSWPSVKSTGVSEEAMKDTEALLQEKCDALESLEVAYADLLKECDALKSSRALNDNSGLITHLQTEIEMKTNKLERLTAHCRELEQEMVNLKSSRVKSSHDTKVSREVQHSSTQTHMNLGSISDTTNFGQSNDIKTLKEEIFVLVRRLEEKDTEVSSLKYEISDLQLQLQEAVKQKEKFSEQAFILQRHVEKLAKFMEQLIRGKPTESMESSSEMLSEVSKCVHATLQLSQTMSQDLSVWDLSKHFAFDDSSLSEKRVSFDEISLPSLSFSKSTKTAAEHEGRAIHSEASVGNMVRTGRRRRWSFSSQLRPESDHGTTDMDHLMISIMSESGDMIESTPFAAALRSKGSFRNYLREELHGRWNFAVNSNNKAPQPKARPCWNLSDKNKTLNSLNALEYKPDREVTQVRPFYLAKQVDNSNLIRLSSDSDIWSEPDRDVSIQRIGIATKGPMLSPAQKSRGREKFIKEKLVSTSGSNVIDKDRPESRIRRRRSGSQTRTSVQLVDKRLSVVESQQSKIAALLQTFEHVASQMSQLTEGSFVEKTESIERISSEMNSLKSILNSAVKELQNLKETVKDTVSKSQEVGVIAEFKENMEKILTAVQSDDHLKGIAPTQAKDIAKEALLELDTFKQQLLSVASSLLSSESMDKLYPSQRSKEVLISNATNLELMIDAEKLRNSQLLKEISDLKNENNVLCQQLEKLQTTLTMNQNNYLAAEKQKEQRTELLKESNNYKSQIEEKELKVQELIAEKEELSEKLARRISLEKTANFMYETKLSDVENLCDQLKGSLKETEAKLKAMEFKCLEYEKDIANISQEKLNTKNERDDLAKTVKDQAEQLVTSEHNLQEVHILCNQLKLECDTAQSKLNALQSKCMQLETKISSLTQEKIDTLNKNKHLEEKLQTQVDKIADMNKKHLDYENEKLSLHHVIENLQTELQNLQKRVNDGKKVSETRMHSVKSFGSEVELLNHQVSNLQKELDEKMNLISDQNETIISLKKTNEFLESRNNVVQSINKSYQQENSELTEQLSQSHITSGAASSSAVELLEKKIEELNVTNANLAQELNDKILMIQEQNSMIINLQKDIQTLEDRCVVSQGSQHLIERVQSDLEEKNNVVLKRSASLENQLRELNAQTLNVNKELQAKCIVIQEQKDIIADLENRISSLEQERKKAGVANQSLELEKQGLLNKTLQLQGTIKDLEEQIEMSSTEVKDAELKAKVALNKKDAELMDLKNENQELTNKILEKDSYIQKLHSHFPGPSTEFTPVEHTRASTLSQQPAMSKQLVQSSAEGKSQSAHHVDGLPEKISELQKELDTVQCQLKESEESVDGLKRELLQRDRNISQQKLQLVSCEEQIQNYHSQLKKLSATKLALQNMESENEKLKSTISELTETKLSSVDYKSERNDDLLSQLMTLRQELIDKEKVLQTVEAAKIKLEHEQAQVMKEVRNVLHETELFFKEKTNEEVNFDLPQESLQWSEQLIHEFVILRNVFDSVLTNSLVSQEQVSSLKTEKELLEKQVSCLEKQLDDKKNSLVSVKKTNSELCTRVTDLEGELKSGINSRSKLYLNHQILISEKEKLNSKVSELETKLKELQEKVTLDDSTKKQAFDSLRTTISEKSVLCDQLQEKVQELGSQLSSVSVLLLEKTELIRELNLSLKSLQGTVVEKTKLSEDLLQKVQALEEELSITNQTFSRKSFADKNEIKVLLNNIVEKTELSEALEVKLQAAEKKLLALPEKVNLITELQNKLENLQTSITEKTELSEALEVKLQAAEKKLLALPEKVNLITELQNKLENLQTSITEKTKLCEALEGKLDTAAKETSEKSILREELESKVKASQDVIAKKIELCENLEGKVQSMEKELLEKSNLIAELQNTIKRFETVLTEKPTATGQEFMEKSKLSKDLEDQNEVLRISLTEKTELCEQLQDKLQTAENKVVADDVALMEKSKLSKDLEDQNEVLRISLTEKAKLCEQLQDKLQTAEKKVIADDLALMKKSKLSKDLEDQNEVLRMNLTEKTELCEQLQDKLQTAENKVVADDVALMEKSKLCKDLEDQNEVLHISLTEKAKLCEQLQDKLQTAEKKVVVDDVAFMEKSKLSKDLEHQNEVLRISLTEKTELCEQLQDKLQTAENKVVADDEALMEKSKRNKDLEDQLGVLRISLTEKAELCEQLRDKSQITEKELLSTRDTLSEKLKANEELENQVASLQTTVVEKTELCKHLEEKKSLTLREKLNRTTELENKNKDLQASITEKDKLYEQLEQRYNTMVKECSSLHDAVSKSSIRIKESENDIKTLKEKAQVSKLQLQKQLDEDVQVLQKKLSDTSVSLSEKSEHINNLENQIKNLQVDITKMTEHREQLEEKCQTLKKEVSTSAQLFAEKSERNKELESDNDTLQAEINEKTELYENLKGEFSAMQKKLSVVEDTLVEKEKLIKKLENDVLIKKETIKELEANKIDDDLKMKALNVSLTQLDLQKQEKIAYEDQIKALNEQMNSLSRKLSRAEIALKRKDNYCKKIEDTSGMLHTKVSELEDQKKVELVESRRKSDPQGSSLSLKHNKSCQISSRSVSQHENTIQELQNHLRSKERVIDQLGIQNSDYRTNIAALENKLKDFRTVSTESKSVSCHLIGATSRKNSVGLQTTDFAHIRSSHSMEKETPLSISKSTERRHSRKDVTYRELVSSLSCFLKVPPDSAAKYLTQLAESASGQEMMEDLKDPRSLTDKEHKLDVLKLKEEKQSLMENLEESRRQKLVLEDRVQQLLYTLEAIDAKDKKLYESGIQITKQSSVLSNKDIDGSDYIKQLTFSKWELQQSIFRLEEELCQFHPSFLKRQLQFIKRIRSIYSNIQSLSFVRTHSDSIVQDRSAPDVIKCIAKERHLSLRMDIEFLQNTKMLMKYFVVPMVKHVYNFDAIDTNYVHRLSENLSKKFDAKKWGSIEKVRGIVQPDEDVPFMDFDQSNKGISFKKEMSDLSIQVSSLLKENDVLRAELQSFKQMSYFTNVAALEILNSNSVMKQHSLEKKLTLAEPGLSIMDALDKASVGSGDDVLILSESESGASLSSGVDLKQPRGKHRQGNEAVLHRRRKDRDATDVKEVDMGFESMAQDIHRSHYSSPDLGIESDPNQDHFAMGQLDSLTEPKSTKSKKLSDGAYTDDDKLGSNSLPRSMKLHAFLNLEDFELLKKEIEECIIVMRSIDSRAKDGLKHLCRDGTPKKSFECCTLKGILDCSNHVVVCLTRSQQLVTHFCVSPVPGPVTKLNREQLVQENQRLKAIIDDLKAQQMQQETDIAAALKRLKKYETYKGFLSKRMLKQLVQTKKVLRQVRTNLNEDEDKTT